MNLADVPGYNQQVFMGIIIVIAMLLQYGTRLAQAMMPPGVAKDLTLAIDVGTGSVRAALVDATGVILSIAAVEQHQVVPAFGWSEQSVTGWWAGVVEAIRAVLERVPGGAQRVLAICACGQMHGTVLVDGNGVPTRSHAPLWNDKRTGRTGGGLRGGTCRG